MFSCIPQELFSFLFFYLRIWDMIELSFVNNLFVKAAVTSFFYHRNLET